jgi:hypothetical protein
MAEQQLARCREMAAELSKTNQSQAASIIIDVVNQTVADKRYLQSKIDFAVMNAHIMLFKLLKTAKNNNN